MLDKFFKKEKPFLGLAGFGGGGTGLAISSQGGYDGVTASGGVISDYESGGNYYRAHVFTSSGALVVTSLGSYGGTAEYLVVAGGGSGGYEGGGGAGGVRTNLAGHPLSTNNPSLTLTGGETYPITVGAGGGRNIGGPARTPQSGANSAILTPTTSIVTATGGGGAGNYPGVDGRFGGSGGGDATGAGTFGYGINPSTPAPLGGPYSHTEGYPGAPYPGTPYGGMGGGGAGGAGHGPGDSPAGAGGEGVQVLIAGPSTKMGIGGPGPGGYCQWYGGGGGGGAHLGPNEGGGGGMGTFADPYAGGGHGIKGGNTTTGIAPAPANATPGVYNTGGGGGGVWNSTTGVVGAGGPGIVIVRYQINAVTSAKATGGSVYYTNTHTVHVFTNPGTFATTASWSAPTSVEYVMVGGGGAGACAYGGGGGAGQYITGTQTVNAHPVSTTIEIGAGGVSDTNQPGYNRDGVDGGTTTWSQGSLTAVGGGGGASGGGGAGSGRDGGSGGGGVVGGGGGMAPTPGSHVGGTGATGGDYMGGGGGGAGGEGAPGPASGDGGAGNEVPATFQSPLINFSGGPSSDKWKVAGGGGGGFYVTATGSPAVGGAGGGGQGGAPPNASTPGNIHGCDGTGGGGGGASDDNSGPTLGGGYGGSGVVLLAYPT